ncbi:MAG: hypothetical protein ACRDKT_15990 [Actinomycetota bacterium]
MSPPRRPRAKFPWERDTGDREAMYKRPIPFHERARLGLKGAIVVASYFVIKEMTRDRLEVGAKILVVIGIALVLVGLMDVLWTWRGKLEHVFVDDRRLQFAVHAAWMVAGAALAIGGAVALR